MATWESIDRALAALGLRFGAPTAGQTTGGQHAAGSLHYDGRGRDYGDTDSDAPAIAQALVPYATGPGAVVAELFYAPLGIFLKDGAPITPSDGLRRGHLDHVHVGVRSGVDLAQAVAAGGGGGGATIHAASLTSATGGGWGGIFAPVWKAAVTVAFVALGAGLAVVGAGRAASIRRRTT